MLEVKLHDKKLEIVKLNAEIVQVRTLGQSCTNCNYTFDLREELTKHILDKHGSKICTERVDISESDKDINNIGNPDLPSTSKCGTCLNTSEDERDLKTHTNSKHVLYCDHCEFQSESSDSLHEHYLLKHNFLCPTCSNIFKTQQKLSKHLCKLEVDNPSFGTFYTRGWFDLKGCNQVFCSDLDRQVAILHCEDCLKEETSCCWAPYKLSSKSEDIIHFQTKNFIKHTKMSHIEVLWPQLSEQTL